MGHEAFHPKPDAAPRARGFRARSCLGLARMFLKGPLKRFGFRKESITRFDSNEEWVADRIEQIDEYQRLFKPFCSFEGKKVLELGCSRGYLLNSFLQEESFTAIGADIDEEALSEARRHLGDRIEFVQSAPESVPLPDQSVDIVYSIDTIEHLSKPKEMLLDIYRVLRPGGLFLVHFHPWYGPYGSHLEDIIPYPWPNVVFPMDALLDAAAELYDSPDYQVACYYRDPQTGKKKPNPYLDRAKWAEFLNHITLGQFNRLLKELPFRVVHKEKLGFGGKTFAAARYLGWLSRIPGPDELFTKAAYYVLSKPEI
jgi:ubiquinone/menaquinone biosynthesis C-methylase UbiE